MNSYFLGCPVWSCEHWAGKIFPRKTKRTQWLRYYSQAFNTVEGNTTFYAMPTIETIERWSDQAAEGFRFALKFPGIITHERQLRNCQYELDQWLDGLQVMHEANRLGPSFIQLPPNFDASQFSVLETFLRQLPDKFPYALEVRHPSCFADPVETKLNSLLSELSIDRVIFDSRALFDKPPSDPSEQEAQRRKPRSPLRTEVTGRHPFVRFIGRNQLDEVNPWISEWAERIGGWINDGKQPYVFVHAPDDQYAPEFALRFHSQLQDICPQLEDLPDWLPPEPKQMDLF